MAQCDEFIAAAEEKRKSGTQEKTSHLQSGDILGFIFNDYRKLIAKMATRRPTPSGIQTDVLVCSSRKCCICFGLHNDLSRKTGQIAHLDHNPANFDFENLAWLCLLHHDEYDSTTRQSKGLTKNEVIAYRENLYKIIGEMRSKLQNNDVDPLSFKLTYGTTPSKATVRTSDQFVILSTRTGPIENCMLDLTREVLVDLEQANEPLLDSASGFQKLMLRGIWFDRKHGVVAIHIDLLHDRDKMPTFSIEDVERLFHDSYGWYGGQIVEVHASIFPVSAYSDSFSPLSNDYYERDFTF